MDTNGFFDLRIGKGEEAKVYRLYFGMFAVEELTLRSVERPSNNLGKIATDLVYAGLCNMAIRNDEPFPKYSDANELIEALFLEDDGMEQYLAMHECFAKSKFGKRLFDKVEEEAKKKVTSPSKKPKSISKT